jgi:Spy/CpxP family protein refolding chaperone
MNKLLGALLCATIACAASPALAQAAGESPSAALLAKVQSDKRGLVEKSMNLTADEAKKFWPLYEKFQGELAGPQKEYTRAVLDYVGAEKSMTDANATRLAKQVLGGALHADREQDPGRAALRKREGHPARGVVLDQRGAGSLEPARHAPPHAAFLRRLVATTIVSAIRSCTVWWLGCVKYWTNPNPPSRNDAA